MKYLSTYYRAQEGKITTSLVLQQMQYENLACPVLFGCLCAQDAMAEELLGWLGRKKLNSTKGIGQTLDEWGVELEQLLARWARIPQERGKDVQSIFSVSGLICIGNEFLMFYHGDALFYIINTRFGKNHVKSVALSETKGIIRGSLEEGVGILIPNHNFVNGISQRHLQEVLNVQELKVEEQLECRLRELGKLGQKYDIQESERWNEEITVSQGSAAILVVTR